MWFRGSGQVSKHREMEKTSSWKFLLIAPMLVFASASASTIYTIAKDFSITIKGTSNLHDWTETVEKATGTVSINWNSDGTFDLEGVSIRIDVHSIKSDHNAMDKNTYEALKADSYPTITFVLTTPVKNIPAKPTKTTIHVKGNLTIAGVTKSVDVALVVLSPGNRRLQFEGSQNVKMPDYNIDPPTSMLGALRTGNEVTIEFKTGIQ
jgi:polyisoprenoid-binding protein YceI